MRKVFVGGKHYYINGRWKEITEEELISSLKNMGFGVGDRLTKYYNIFCKPEGVMQILTRGLKGQFGRIIPLSDVMIITKEHIYGIKWFQWQGRLL